MEHGLLSLNGRGKGNQRKYGGKPQILISKMLSSYISINQTFLFFTMLNCPCPELFLVPSLSILSYAFLLETQSSHLRLSCLLTSSCRSACCLCIFSRLFCNLCHNVPWGPLFCPGIASLLSIPFSLGNCTHSYGFSCHPCVDDSCFYSSALL